MDGIEIMVESYIIPDTDVLVGEPGDSFERSAGKLSGEPAGKLSGGPTGDIPGPLAAIKQINQH